MGYVMPNMARAFDKESCCYLRAERGSHLHRIVHESECVHHDMQENENNDKSTSQLHRI